MNDSTAFPNDFCTYKSCELHLKGLETEKFLRNDELTLRVRGRCVVTEFYLTLPKEIGTFTIDKKSLSPVPYCSILIPDD